MTVGWRRRGKEIGQGGGNPAEEGNESLREAGKERAEGKSSNVAESEKWETS